VPSHGCLTACTPAGYWIGTEHQGGDVQQPAFNGSDVSGGTAWSLHHSPILCSCLVAGCEDVGDKVPCKLRRDTCGSTCILVLQEHKRADWCTCARSHHPQQHELQPAERAVAVDTASACRQYSYSLPVCLPWQSPERAHTWRLRVSPCRIRAPADTAAMVTSSTLL
jgi:hypothetical protein